MKREIKFRGKRVDNGEWVDGGIIQWNGVAAIIKHVHVVNGIWKTEKIKVDPETVGQFTGLKDMNGNEIYEGDIIQYVDIDLKCYVGEVAYRNGAFDVLGNWNEWIGEGYIDKCKITGNIHDK